MNSPQRFTKKPVEIEAQHLATDNVAAVAEWCGGHNVDDLEWDYAAGAYWKPDHSGWFFAPARERGLVIHTLEGDHFASVGDWVIRGLAGEFYPCRGDIFEATYERVADGEPVAVSEVRGDEAP